MMHSGMFMITIIMLIEPSPSQTKKINTPCLLKKLQKAVVFSEFIYTFANKYLDINKNNRK